MKCDICSNEFNNMIDHHYLLLMDGIKYECAFDNRYIGSHSDHINSKYDVMLCPDCYTHYDSKIFINGKFKIPSCIPLVQSKRFILEVFRRRNVKHRIKR